MIRYFYSICFLAIGTGLPVLAKNTATVRPTPSTSSKLGTKAITPSCAPLKLSLPETKEQIGEKSEIIVTPDTARGAVSPSFAALPKSSASTPASIVPKPGRKHAVTELSLITRNSTADPGARLPVRAESEPIRTGSGPLATESAPTAAGGRLARVTAYWAAEGDYYTERCISATGVRLHDGHCAVDPSIIPYGSVVDIAGVGKFLAVDTGSAVISRTAAREGGHTPAERNALVVDLFFEDRSEGEKFAASAAKYASISWWTPSSTTVQAQAARSLFAEEDWTKIQGKQL